MSVFEFTPYGLWAARTALSLSAADWVALEAKAYDTISLQALLDDRSVRRSAQRRALLSYRDAVSELLSKLDGEALTGTFGARDTSTMHRLYLLGLVDSDSSHASMTNFGHAVFQFFKQKRAEEQALRYNRKRIR